MQQPSPAPPAPYAPSPTPVAVIAGQQVTVAPRGADPSQVLEAFRQQRSELRDQLERLENQRENLTEQLPGITDAAAKTGILGRIATIDARIGTVEKAIADADASVARAAAIPGAVVPEPPEPRRNGPPEEFFIFLMIFTIVIGLPIAVAIARRIWKKSVTTIAAIPSDIYERFNRIDQAIDAVAVEVERIGEGQRYVTKLVNDRAIGAGAAEPVELPARNRAEERR